MRLKSTNSHDLEVSFKDAVLRCLPSDGGLYVPTKAVDLRQAFFDLSANSSFHDLASAVTPLLLQGELNPFCAARVAESAYGFEPELTLLDDNFSLLTLHNSPTGNFKDFGAGFFATVMEELLKKNNFAMILSTAVGNNGISLGHAFQRRHGLTAVLLYPSGRIFGLDEENFVSNGGNIIPIQVRGTLDDCQRLRNAVINSLALAQRYNITSANTINFARLLPQTFYYLYAYTKLPERLRENVVFSVPSGNFGNLVSGLYAWKFGLPASGFIAAMNANNAFGDFLQGGDFKAEEVIATRSPALDVSNPANYQRLRSFYDENPAAMRDMVFPASVDDEKTFSAMEKMYRLYGELIDPHGAVAFAAAQDFAASGKKPGSHIVVVSTGHPAKEPEIVKAATGQVPSEPRGFQLLKREVKPVAAIEAHLGALEGAIAACF